MARQGDSPESGRAVFGGRPVGIALSGSAARNTAGTRAVVRTLKRDIRTGELRWWCQRYRVDVPGRPGQTLWENLGAAATGTGDVARRDAGPRYSDNGRQYDSNDNQCDAGQCVHDGSPRFFGQHEA